uniref:Craniofacial development protein 2-like n=1 Tax=Nicotiana tabacum TaxID=4097 RepID=A0A1S4CR98_TOBAC|nr:PREDICTED: craniofacial development protein 2-like [Nicotiana tabacum]
MICLNSVSTSPGRKVAGITIVAIKIAGITIVAIKYHKTAWAICGYSEVHGGFDFGERNGGGTSLLDFAKAFELVIANSSFSKWEEHLVTFQSSVVKTQIDYFLLRRGDRRLCEDCKVIPGETLATQHRLL